MLRYQSTTNYWSLSRAIWTDPYFWFPMNPKLLDQKLEYNVVKCGSLWTSKPRFTGDKCCYHFDVDGIITSSSSSAETVPFRSNVDEVALTDLIAGSSVTAYEGVPAFGPGLSDQAWAFEISDIIDDTMIFAEYHKVKFVRLTPQIFVRAVISADVVLGSLDPLSVSEAYGPWVDWQLYYAAPRSRDSQIMEWFPAFEWEQNYSSDITFTPEEVLSFDFSRGDELVVSVCQDIVDNYLGSYTYDISKCTARSGEWTVASHGLDQVEAEMLSRQCYTMLSNRYEKVKQFSDWGTLCQIAVDNINYLDINTIAYLKEFKDTFGELKAFKNVLRNPRSIKNWASFYLSLQYGTQLTVADTIEIFNALTKAAKDIKKQSKKHPWKACRSRIDEPIVTPWGQGTRHLNYKVYYEPSDSRILSAYQSLAKWDLFPTLGNTWDLIPFSFVLDWFLDVGTLLEAVDAANFAASLNCVGSLATQKDIITYSEALEFSNFQIQNLVLTVYNRQYARQLHLPKPSLDFSSSYKNNIPQLLAILIQKKK